MGLLYDDNIVKKLLKAVTKYCGRDLDCINVQKGDSYTTIFNKINQVFCELGYTFSNTLDGCNRGLVVTENATNEILYSECLDCNCPECESLNIDFELVGEAGNVQANISGGSGNYEYNWSVDQAVDYSFYVDGSDTPMELGTVTGTPHIFRSIAGPNLNVLNIHRGPDILINLTVIDIETGCIKTKSYFYQNIATCNLTAIFNITSEYITTIALSTTVTGGSGDYTYTYDISEIVANPATGGFSYISFFVTNRPTINSIKITPIPEEDVDLSYGFGLNVLVKIKDNITGCEFHKFITLINNAPA